MDSKVCDNTSVGVIIRDKHGRYALLKRKFAPYGIAPSAGHIDDHGTREQAAIQEVYEETGIRIPLAQLGSPLISARKVTSECRRPGGYYHVWTIYEVQVPDGTEIKPSPDETKGATWYTPEELNVLAQKTRAYKEGRIPEDEWVDEPGLEKVWLPFMEELRHVSRSGGQ